MEECDSDVLEGEIIRTRKKRKKNIEMDEMLATQEESVQIEMLPGMLRHEHMSAPAQSSQSPVSHSISTAGKSNLSSPDVHMNTRTGRDENRNRNFD